MKITDIIETEYANIQKTEQELVLTDSQGIDSIIQAYEEWGTKLREIFIEYNYLNKIYSMANEIIEKKEYDRTDITAFCNHLSDFSPKCKSLLEQDKITYRGIFLSGLINLHHLKIKSNNSYHIITENMSNSLQYFGFQNAGATIFIQGNVGDFTGYEMSLGTITIFGNTNNGLGTKMFGGKIIVKGNTRDETGNEMKGGDIFITGFTKWGTGHKMRGGTIHVLKKIKHLSVHKIDGDIYCAGKQVYS